MTLTRSTTRNTNAVFTAVLVVALVALYVTPAFASTQVNLHAPHVGASSETFNNESDDGGLGDFVVWHFVLNGLDRGTAASTIYVTFGSAGAKVAAARVVGQGQTQHFYVGTPTHDTIVSAYALTDSGEYNNLVLSHVSWEQVPPPDDPPPDDPPPDDPPPDDPPPDDPPPDDPPPDDPPPDDPPPDDPPPDDPPTDDPPTDDPPQDDPPTDDPPTDDPPQDDPPTDDPPADDPPTDDPPEDEEPFLPFTEDEPELEYLPFTGVDGGSLAALTLLLGAAGAALRRRF